MPKEYLVLTLLAVVGILLVTVLGRPDKPRETLFIFLVAQSVSWPATLFLVLSGSLDNPVRLFPKATEGNFGLAFVFYPSLIVSYYWHYPRSRGRIVRLIYTLALGGIGAAIHIALQHYTDLIRYLSFSGYKMWIILIVSFSVVRIYTDWFFDQLAKSRSNKLR